HHGKRMARSRERQGHATTDERPRNTSNQAADRRTHPRSRHAQGGEQSRPSRFSARQVPVDGDQLTLPPSLREAPRGFDQSSVDIAGVDPIVLLSRTTSPSYDIVQVDEIVGKIKLDSVAGI